jgi:serine/threonine protein kinase
MAPPGYKLGKSLGQGGFGEVFEAVHRGSGVSCAIKLIEGDADARRRHKREVEFQRRANSPHVMMVTDFGDGWHAMPLAAGALWDLGGGLNEEECVDVLVHSARGLLVAHEQDRIHRDVSPGNILKLGENWVVSDFGLISNPRGESSIERTRGVMGTRSYRAPEVESVGAHHVDSRADIYSLGRVLRFLLGGRPDAPVAAHWRGVIDRLTATNREERPASMHEVLVTEGPLRRSIRAARRERWLQLRDASAGPSGMSENAMRVIRWIYGLDPSFFRHHELRAFAEGRTSTIRFNLGWGELEHRGFLEEVADDNGNPWAWKLTPHGKAWAREHAPDLERDVGESQRELPQPPPCENDAPF